MLSSFYIDKYTEYLRNRNKYKNSLILPQNNQINYRIINTQRPKTKVDDNIISKKSFNLVWNLSLGAQAQGFNSSGRDIALSYSNGLWISVAYSNIGVNTIVTSTDGITWDVSLNVLPSGGGRYIKWISSLSIFVVGSGDAKAGDGVIKIVFVGVGLGVGIKASFGPPSLLEIITETTPMLPRFE